MNKFFDRQWLNANDWQREELSNAVTHFSEWWSDVVDGQKVIGCKYEWKVPYGDETLYKGEALIKVRMVGSSKLVDFFCDDENHGLLYFWYNAHSVEHIGQKFRDNKDLQVLPPNYEF